MKSSEYKKLIQEDIQWFKTLDIDILKPSIFYKKISSIMLYLYMIIVGIPFLTMVNLKSTQFTREFYLSDWVILSVLFMIISMFILPKIAEYVTFKETIKPHLRLGKIIDMKFKFYFRAIIIIYTIWALIDTVFFFTADGSHIGERMFTVFPGFLLGALLASILFQMEIARIGIATIFDLISGIKNGKSIDN